MSFIGELVEHIEDARLSAQGRVLCKTEILSNFVGCNEPDSEDVRGETIRVFFHDLDGLVAVLLEDLRGVPGTDAVTLQEDHHLTDLLLVRPGFPNHTDAFLADAVNLTKTLDRLFDHIKGLFSKGFHDPLRHDRADALDESRSEILLDACNGGWNQGLVADYFELLPELWMGRPFAGCMEHLPWHGCHEISDRGDKLTEALYLQTSNSETCLVIVEGDPFDLTLEILKHSWQILEPIGCPIIAESWLRRNSERRLGSLNIVIF